MCTHDDTLRRYRRRPYRPLRVLLTVALLLAFAAVLAGALPTVPAAAADRPGVPWEWPTTDARAVIAPFRAPAHAYGPGHRGVDIAASGEVRAPADGVIAFAGTVVDRPLLTIDHGNGLVTTLEPVRTALAPGTVVRRGDPVGPVAAGGHTPASALHVGVRENGRYINPLLLFGGVERAVLLPCGSGGC